MSIDIDTPWGAVIKAVGGIISKVVPDTAAAAAAKAQLEQMTLSGQLQEDLVQLQSVTSAQTDIDKVEAASTSVFIAGWRPFVGWVCGVGLAMSCIVAPLFTWIAVLVGHPTPFPKLDDPLLQSTLAGMLGLGYGLRTYEKFKGVASSH
jgi:Holin of 3TMs, for gene-transfer release